MANEQGAGAFGGGNGSFLTIGRLKAAGTKRFNGRKLLKNATLPQMWVIFFFFFYLSPPNFLSLASPLTGHKLPISLSLSRSVCCIISITFLRECHNLSDTLTNENNRRHAITWIVVFIYKEFFHYVWSESVTAASESLSSSSPYVKSPLSCDDEHHRQSNCPVSSSIKDVLVSPMWPGATWFGPEGRRSGLFIEGLLQSMGESSRCREEILMSRGLVASPSLTASRSLCKRPTKPNVCTLRILGVQICSCLAVNGPVCAFCVLPL